MLTVSGLGHALGGQVLFHDVSMQLDAGNRYGIVGANGSGKSTFLRILAGQETAAEGETTLPRRCVVGVLEQDHFRYEDTPIIDVVMMGHEELWAAFVKKERMLSGPADAFDADKYADVEDRILALNGYALESKASEILEGMQIPTAKHRQPLSTLSGGYKLRVLLARTLAGNPDLLLLDEPNNHLDILSLRWLEKFLMSFAGCAIVVSHDHRFLDNVATHILDVDYQGITSYKGNYEAFLSQKGAERERRQREIGRREKEIAEHKAFITRFKAKATKARQANSRQKRMEKIEITALPQSSRRYPKFHFPQRRPSGREVVQSIGISKAFGDNVVLSDVDLTVARGDRVAIIGPNGIGKSTFLKVLVGAIEADDGLVEWGYEAHVGYFAQDHHEVLSDPEQTVLGWLWGQCPDEVRTNVHGRLGAVLFYQDEVEKKLDNLSGGEAARLVLAGLAARKPNVLVLDEPTNHLDLEGVEALAAGLCKTDSTVIFVSHDRWFVSKVATRILEIRHDSVEDFPGTYEEYLAQQQTDYLDRVKMIEDVKRKKR